MAACCSYDYFDLPSFFLFAPTLFARLHKENVCCTIDSIFRHFSLPCYPFWLMYCFCQNGDYLCLFMSHSRRTSKECIWQWHHRTVLAPVLLRALYDPVKQTPRETWYGSVLKQPVQPIQFSFTSGSFYHHFQWPACLWGRAFASAQCLNPCSAKAHFPPYSGHFT